MYEKHWSGVEGKKEVILQGEGGRRGDAKSKRNHTVNLGQKEWRSRRIMTSEQSHVGKGD